MFTCSKWSKVFLCLVALIVILLSMAGVASAQTAQYRSTQVFLDYLDQKSIKYTYSGIKEDVEYCKVSYSLDNFDSQSIVLLFDEDCESVSLRMWNIITASAGKNYILNTLADLNANYKYVKYVFDESDSSVQAEIDMQIDAETCGRPVYDTMMLMFISVDHDEVSAKLHSLE